VPASPSSASERQPDYSSDEEDLNFSCPSRRFPELHAVAAVQQRVCGLDPSTHQIEEHIGDMTQTFSPRALRALRIDRGYSQQQLAAAVRRNFFNVGGWERGTAMPGRDSIERLARVLECRIEDLFEDSASVGEADSGADAERASRARLLPESAALASDNSGRRA
jgi:transcriptional regulator with XRE-family HTH domain